MKLRQSIHVLTGLLFSLGATDALTSEYSPYVEQDHPQQLLWGDTHLHTSYSTDAGLIGNSLGPEQAFRLARGETVQSSTGVRARLIRPLDFMVVADHAENLGLSPLIQESNPDLLASPWGRKIHDLVKAKKYKPAYVMWGTEMAQRNDPLKDPYLVRSVWNRLVDAAESFNEPGVFTALHGFEWTSSKDANNLHRVVVFRDDREMVRDLVPFSNYDSSDPEALWDWLQRYQRDKGGQVMAIPHNGNLSNGLMFDDQTLSGEPFSADYARRRAFWEPLYEVTQIKGDGETHPALSPNDEYADFWRWDRGNFALYGKQANMLPREYARTALARGLKYAEQLGENPFKFGMIGASDSHTSLATTREENYFGKAPLVEPGVGEPRYREKITGTMPSLDGSDPTIRHYESLASGLAGVWARENSREAIFDAMRRREVYATTGTRISLRLFAGWEFEAADADAPDFIALGYDKGVPMGGDLTAAPRGKSPRFLVRAMGDADGANLDRVQIVKGWLGKDGQLQEKIYDVACGRDRSIENNRCDRPVGNTVDLERASYSNSIGEIALQAWWQDPDFDAAERAFYYVRVLEIPTPTWLAYDRVSLGDELPEDATLVHQERAYSSPVWYTP